MKNLHMLKQKLPECAGTGKGTGRMHDSNKDDRIVYGMVNEKDLIHRIIKKLQEEGILSPKERQKIEEFMGRV